MQRVACNHTRSTFLGQAVKKYRLSLGLNRNNFADMFGVSIDTIQRWEWGITRPSKAVLDEIIKKYIKNCDC